MCRYVRVQVEDEEARSRIEWKALPHLLDDPHTGGMLRGLEMQNLPSVMADNEEAVGDAERNRWTVKKSMAAMASPVIVGECEQAHGGFMISRCAPHPVGNGSLRDIEAVYEKLAMDARRSHVVFSTTMRKIRSRISLGSLFPPTGFLTSRSASNTNGSRRDASRRRSQERQQSANPSARTKSAARRRKTVYRGQSTRP